MDQDVAFLQEQLEIVALACLEIIRAERERLTEIELNRLRNAARAALQRAKDLPQLVQWQRDQWIERTVMFTDAVIRLLASYVKDE